MANGGCAGGYCTLDEILNDPGIIWCLGTADEFAITTCEQAVAILDQRDFSNNKKRASDAAYTLAMHLLAAQLNFTAGAASCQEAQDAAAAGEALLCSIGFDGTGTYLRPNNALYGQALALAATLDCYNNGNLCPSGDCGLMAPISGTYPPNGNSQLYEEQAEILVYPNPSSSDVTIEFSLPEDKANVTLEIYNIMGERVQFLFDGEVEARVHQTVTIPGNTLAYGTYIYRLSSGNKVYHGKLIILE